jgi:circadian clock protein KaiC
MKAAPSHSTPQRDLASMESSAASEIEDRFPRISTGDPQADEILGGGFPSNSINIIMGQPGTGKTIFAERLLFHNANGGRPLLYVTTLSEPMSKVVSYAQRLGFFDVAKIGDQILYDDLGPALARDGPGAILPFITDAIKRLSPALIVIDSFKAVHDLATSTHEMRRIISSLAGVLSASDVTAFLIGEYTQSDSESHPEFAVADSIVQLERHSLGARDERFVRVLKLRGSGYREGQHAFQITGRGLKIFPRLVTPDFSDYDLNLRRIPTGVPGLDEIIGGGLWSGSTTVVVGSTGTGKTTIALQFALTGANSGDAALFVNFQENPAQVRRLISTLAGDEASDNADFHHLYFSPVELQIDSVIVTIFDLIRTRNIKRVVIDAVGDLATAASDAQRLHDYMYSLVQHFVVNDVTCLLNFESPIGTTGADEMQQRFSYMADNVLLLSPADESTRTIRVIKTRNSAHDRDAHKIRIDASGVKVH